MNALNAVLVAATIVVAGVGPFVAVHIGAKAFDFDEPEDDTPNDDTTQLPRITDDPYHY
jgi:hypothetical protein